MAPVQLNQNYVQKQQADIDAALAASTANYNIVIVCLASSCHKAWCQWLLVIIRRALTVL